MDKNFDWDQIKIDAAINALNALVSLFPITAII